MKKFLLLFMALFALVLPARAFVVDDIDYLQMYDWDGENYIENHELAVIGYYGTESNLEIPQFVTYNNTRYIVTNIGNPMDAWESIAFADKEAIQIIELPNTIVYINRYALNGCSNLREINIPSSVKSIGDRAFEGCKSLISIELPENLKTIDNGLFYNCSSLQSVNIPSGVTKIGSESLYGCSSLKGISIPGSVQSIGYSAFCYCTSLQSVTLPKSLKLIESSVFSGCCSLVC